MSQDERRQRSNERMTQSYDRFFRWGGRSLGFTGAAFVPAIVGFVLLPAFSGLATALIVILLLLSLVCLIISIVCVSQLLIARYAYHRQFSPSEWKAAYNEEIRRRGAPGWYIRASTRGRAAFWVAVGALAAGVGGLWQLVGAPRFGFAHLGYLGILTVLSLAVGLSRLKR